MLGAPTAVLEMCSVLKSIGEIEFYIKVSVTGHITSSALFGPHVGAEQGNLRKGWCGLPLYHAELGVVSVASTICGRVACRGLT